MPGMTLKPTGMRWPYPVITCSHSARCSDGYPKSWVWAKTSTPTILLLYRQSGSDPKLTSIGIVSSLKNLLEQVIEACTYYQGLPWSLFLPTPLHSFISLVYFLHHLCYNFCSVTISVITTCFVQRTPPFLPHPFVYVCIILINMDISCNIFKYMYSAGRMIGPGSVKKGHPSESEPG